MSDGARRVERWLGPFVVMRHRVFAVVATGNFVSLLGTWSQSIGIGWAATRLTGSALLITVAFGAQFVPTLFASPFGGLIADRLDRRHVTMVGNLGMAIPALLTGFLLQVHSLDIASLIALAFVGGTLQALTQPAMTALLPHLVEPNEVSAAVSVNSILLNLSRFAGSALGGLVIAVYGTSAVFYFNAVSFLAVVLAWGLVHPVATRASQISERFLQRLAGGWQFAKAHRPVRNLLLVTVTVSCFLVQLPLLPLITKELLHAGSATYGLLTAGNGLAAMVGAFVAGRIAPAHHRRAVVVAIILLAASVLGLGLSHDIAISFLMETFYGFGLFSLLTITTTRIVMASDDAYLGRVLALQGMSAAGIVPISGALAGVIATVVGPAATLVGAGLALLAVFLWVVLTGMLSVLDEPEGSGPFAQAATLPGGKVPQGTDAPSVRHSLVVQAVAESDGAVAEFGAGDEVEVIGRGDVLE